VSAAKGAYVALARGAGRAAGAVGLIAWLDARAGTSRRAHWARSLFAIHDAGAMAALDVPWWTYAAIDAVAAHLAARPQARVFEWGAGASTVWLARRAAHVTSVEHVPAWHARVAGLLAATGTAARVALRCVPPDAVPLADPATRSGKPGAAGQGFAAYASAIEAAPGAFDLIVVDGRARAACLGLAVGRLAPGGMIVVDNSARARYRAALRAAERAGLRAERLRGLTPALPYPEETTLLRAPGAP